MHASVSGSPVPGQVPNDAEDVGKHSSPGDESLDSKNRLAPALSRQPNGMRNAEEKSAAPSAPSGRGSFKALRGSDLARSRMEPPSVDHTAVVDHLEQPENSARHLTAAQLRHKLKTKSFHHIDHNITLWVGNIAPAMMRQSGVNIGSGWEKLKETLGRLGEVDSLALWKAPEPGEPSWG
eukprot:SAG11_NODE_9708_length_887_cov_2.151015_2_plen_179_part_01